MRKLRVLVFACTTLLCSTTVFAQFDSAAVSGAIRDASGAILPGVTVALTNVASGISRDAVTNESGIYTVANVLVGDYRLTAALTGFRTITQEGVRVSSSQNIRVDIQMELGAVSEEITSRTGNRTKQVGLQYAF